MIMTLTGRCKEDFDKWFESEESNLQYYEEGLSYFQTLPSSMRYGVYVDFFDVVRVSILIELSKTDGFYESFVKGESCYDGLSRLEARIAAVSKANEIYNSRI